MNKENKERLLELLSDQTVFGLTAEESMELDQLKSHNSNWENFASFELAAAAIGLQSINKTIEMPEKLRTKILADADGYFKFSDKNQEIVNFQPEFEKNSPPTVDEITDNRIEAAPNRRFWQWSGWAVAAAACVALVFILWTNRPQQSSEIAKSPDIIQTPAPEFSAAQKREQLIATASDTVEINLTSPKGKEDISGDVVWSNSQQKGFVRFRGLPVNDPNEKTYQLWIIDELRNEKYPVSGGVFDVSANGEIVVPINAELKIKKPTTFAVSVEKPGGVVVSVPERLIAVAKI